MTKLIQQLSFSSSIYQGAAVDASPEPDVAKPTKTFESGASLSSGAVGSKRSAVSASDAECFSLCLGAGPLCYNKPGGPDVPALGSAPPGGAGAGGGRGGGGDTPPSTPDHDDNNCDLLSALLCGTSLSGSAETLLSPRDNPTLAADREPIINAILARKDRQPVKVDFKIYLTENTASYWEAVVQGSTIYLRLPGVLSSGSKESFITLLDFAEERLQCTNCIVCVRKNRGDRATLLRTFMFMGFQILPPSAPLLPRELASPEYVFLHYNMQ